MSDNIEIAFGKPKFSPDLGTDDYVAWETTTRRLAEVSARDNLSRGEVSRRSGVSMGVLTPWYEGNYTGNYRNQTARINRWIDSVEDQRSLSEVLPESPDFIETRIAREILDTLFYAQLAPEMVTITLGAGMGKTTTCRQYISIRPSAYLVTMRPTTSGKHMMLIELGIALGIDERNAGKLDRAIGIKLKRNGRKTLLIIDEAQNLTDEAVNELRYFLDEYGCGIALVGNDEIHKRFGSAEPRAGAAQIHRRIGKRLFRLSPYEEDIAALLDGWRIEEPDQRRYLSGIGQKPGALGQIDKTIKLAAMTATGAGRAMSLADLKAAWANRIGGQ